MTFSWTGSGIRWGARRGVAVGAGDFGSQLFLSFFLVFSFKTIIFQIFQVKIIASGRQRKPGCWQGGRALGQVRVIDSYDIITA